MGRLQEEGQEQGRGSAECGAVELLIGPNFPQVIEHFGRACPRPRRCPPLPFPLQEGAALPPPYSTPHSALPPPPPPSTGGCGAVALLIGPDAPLVLDAAWRACYSDHTEEFCKPLGEEGGGIKGGEGERGGRGVHEGIRRGRGRGKRGGGLEVMTAQRVHLPPLPPCHQVTGHPMK